MNDFVNNKDNENTNKHVYAFDKRDNTNVKVNNMIWRSKCKGGKER